MRRPRVMQKHKGFTLIEIMLVLVLLSVTAMAVIATIPSSSNDVAKKYARSFYQRFQLLNEEAILSGLDFGIRVDGSKSSYVLMTLTSKGWQETKFEKIPALTELPDETTLSLTLGNGVWDDDRLFKPSSLFDEDRFADLEDEKKPKPPQLFLLSSAEMTPFTLSFYPTHGDEVQDGWRVLANESRVITLLAPGETDEKK